MDGWMGRWEGVLFRVDFVGAEVSWVDFVVGLFKEGEGCSSELQWAREQKSEDVEGS